MEHLPRYPVAITLSPLVWYIFRHGNSTRGQEFSVWQTWGCGRTGMWREMSCKRFMWPSCAFSPTRLSGPGCQRLSRCWLTGSRQRWDPRNQYSWTGEGTRGTTSSRATQSRWLFPPCSRAIRLLLYGQIKEGSLWQLFAGKCSI